MSQQYPGSTAADVQAVLSNVPVSTKNLIIKALQANGLLSDTSHIGIVTEVNPGPSTFVNANQEQLVLLGPNSNTTVNSNAPVIVGLDSGTNFVNINHLNTSRDRADTIIGGSGNDTIVGNTAADSLVAGSGSEYVASGGGKDTIRGGSGHDTLTGGGQSAIYAGSGSTTIVAGQSILGTTAHDTIQAGSGSDKIRLVAGNNTVYAPTSGGKATINAGSGHDTIYGPMKNQGAETINSGGHTQLNLDSGSVTYNLTAKSADTVFGGSGSGFVNLNKSATDITSVKATTVGGQSAQTITFGSGGSITTVGTVNLTYTKPH